MTPEDRLRRALRSSAPPATTDPATWNRVTKRSRALRAQRRLLGSTVALVAVVALTLGVLAATGSFDSGASRSIVATPSPTGTTAQGDVVAALDHSIVVLSSTDGRVVRTLVDGLDHVGTVAVSPDGSTVYYSHSVRTCLDGRVLGAGEIARVPISGGTPESLLGGATDPLISPDGRWMAYSLGDCTTPGGVHVGVLDLSTRAHYWPLDGTADTEHAVPHSWAADSQSLLYLGGQGDVFRLDGIPTPTGSPTNLTPGIDPVTAATFTHDGKVLIARQQANTYMVQHFDPEPRGIDIRFIAEGQSPTAMTFDTGDRLLLRAADGSLSVQQGTVVGSGTSADIPDAVLPQLVRGGVHGAAWLPRVTNPPPATAAPATTLPATTPTTTSTSSNVVGARSLAVDGGGNLVFSKPNAHQVWRRNTDGTLTLLAGTGMPGSDGDRGSATEARLDEPDGTAIASDGTIFIADRAANRVRAINPDGTITTVAGTGTAGFIGDGGPASDAQLDNPVAVALAPDGDLYIVDNGGVRRVSNGIISPVLHAGPGSTSGLVVDGQPAALFPSAIAIDHDGDLYVADFSPKLLAKYSPDGTLIHVWNDLYVSEAGLATAPDGSIVIADYSYAIDRIVGTELTTVEKFSLGSIAGLGGAFRPSGVAVNGDGTIYASDTGFSAGTAGAVISIDADGTTTALEGT